MRKTKHKLIGFTFYDRTGIQSYLEKQAAKGWMLEKVSYFGWKFRRIEPKKIHFAVTYFPRGSNLDPEPLPEQREFEEFCAHNGWLLANSAGEYQIYYNEAEDPIPMETDPLVELETIHRAAKKKYIPGYVTMLILLLFGFAMLAISIRIYPIHALSDNFTFFGILWMLYPTISLAVPLIGYFRWYKKARQMAEESGEFLPTRGFRNLELTMISAIMVIGFTMLMSLNWNDQAFWLVSIARLIIFVTVFGLALEGLKKAKLSKGMIMFVLMCGLTVYNTMFEHYVDDWFRDWTSSFGKEKTITYRDENGVYELYQHEMLLDARDLWDTGYGYYSTKTEQSGSFLLSRYEGEQFAPVGEDGTVPTLGYDLYEVHYAPLGEFVLEAALCNDRPWVGSPPDRTPIDAAPWGADEAWRLLREGEPINRYVIRWDNLILRLVTSWELTEEQMGTVIETIQTKVR